MRPSPAHSDASIPCPLLPSVSTLIMICLMVLDHCSSRQWMEETVPRRLMEIVDASLAFLPHGRQTAISLELAAPSPTATQAPPAPVDSGTGEHDAGSTVLAGGRPASKRTGGDPAPAGTLHAVLPLGSLSSLLLACGQSMASPDVSLGDMVGSTLTVETDGAGAVATVGDPGGLRSCEAMPRVTLEQWRQWQPAGPGGGACPLHCYTDRWQAGRGT